VSNQGTGKRPGQRGFSLAEMAAVTVVVAIIAVVALPTLGEANRAAALAGAAGRLRGLMFRCRAFAIMNVRSTGLVFEKRADSSWRCYIAADGDGDGILRRDIESLTDPIVSEVLEFAPDTAGLGILHGEFVPDPSGRGRLKGDLDDPVRAGRGDIITFTPQGHATPSSVYLTDHHARMRVLRIYGGTGRVISLVWRRGWPEWRQSAL
jgi:prepilin-type N-terminal cleavage/methylation domain-containing protein